MFNVIHSPFLRQSQRRTEASRGFAFVLLAIVLFLAAAIGITVLADYTFKTEQRKRDIALLADVYRGITGDPAKETFGYLGDVGSYPTTGGNADNSGYPALSATAGTYNSPAVGTLEYDITETDLAQAGMPVVDGCPNMYNLVVTSHKRPTDTITIPYNAKGAYDFLE